MTRLPQIAWLADGKRLHLQDGPIDLIVEAKGDEVDIRAAYQAAARRFTGLLDQLCEELTALRQPADRARCLLRGVVARRMHDAVAPFAAEHFITPMAAVAGAVAEEILSTMLNAASLTRLRQQWRRHRVASGRGAAIFGRCDGPTGSVGCDANACGRGR